MIQFRNLRKRYGDFEALRGVSTTIERGEIVGLLGPNGAGKTTAMKILVGYLLPSEGSIEVDGLDVVEHPIEVQRKIGYLPENAPVYLDMLVQEYLQFTADMRGLPRGSSRGNIVRAVEECGIGEVLTRAIGELSKGYRQRVGLAASILHDPEILILDEPTTGLDPNQIVEVRDLIRRMGTRKTVIFSTHILPEVEVTCDRAIILIDGEVRADGKLDELTHSRVQVVTVKAADPSIARERFAGLPGVASVGSPLRDDDFCTFRLELEDDIEIGESVARLVGEQGWPLRELRRDDRTLEHVFRELTLSGAGVAS